jgi:hypothetical protein
MGIAVLHPSYDTMSVRIGEFDFDPEIIPTLGWISSVRAYLEEIETIMPSAKHRAINHLSETAKRESWDAATFELETAILESNFDDHFPRLLRYSIVTLLHTVVETQMFRLADYLRRKQGLALTVKDFRGTGIKRTKLYLHKVVGLNVADDPAWKKLCDLNDLRDIIVHRGGLQGPNKNQQKEVRRLINEYNGGLSLLGPEESPDSEIEVSLDFCRCFLDTIEQFFRRLFQKAGMF